MKRIAVLSIALSTIFSLASLFAVGLAQSDKANAMAGPVYVDTACDTVRVAEASPALKEWLKAQRRTGACAPACDDLERFVKDVAANNKTLRAKCGAAK